MTSPPRILIVDDSRFVRAVHRQTVERLKKYEVLEAENGEVALSTMAAEIDTLFCVILDLEMPVLDGWGFLKHKLGLSAPQRDLPVIVVTGKQGEEAARVRELGAWDVIEKPISVMALIRILAQIEQSRQATLGPAATASDPEEDRPTPEPITVRDSGSRDRSDAGKHKRDVAIRTAPRVEVAGGEVKVGFRSLANFLEVFASNISTSGMFVECDEWYEIGARFRFVFDLGDEDPALEGMGEVSWIRREASAHRKAGMGVRFLHLTQESEALIEQIVVTHSAEKARDRELASVKARPQSGKKVLVVDDSKFILRWTADVLGKAGFEVETDATVWIEDVISDFQPDLVMMDVEMGMQDGAVTTAQLKRGAMGRDLRIVLYSGKAETELAELASQSNADGYIKKTDNVHQLIAEVMGQIS